MGIHIFQGRGNLLQTGFGTLHTCLQLSQGGIAGGLGRGELQLGLVDLQLGGRADFVECLEVFERLAVQADLRIQHGLLILVALHRSIIADLGRIPGSQGTAQIQRAQHVPGLDHIAGLGVDRRAFGGGRHHNGLFIFSGNLSGDAVFRRDGIGVYRLHLNCRSSTFRLLLHRSLAAAACQGHHHPGSKQPGRHSFMIHNRLTLHYPFRIPCSTAQQ